jgi:D-amino-acid dehydrogenase
MSRANVIIIGCGIVGLSTAIWLRRSGAEVAVIDQKSAGDPGAASYGNAGILAACSVVPVTAPGMISKSPKMLFDPEFPLFLRWSYLPQLVPWLIKYLSNANDTDTKRISAGLTPLTSDSVEQHKSLTHGLTAASKLRSSDYCFVYPDKTAFDNDHSTWMLRKAAGFQPELITGKAVLEYEPTLAPNLQLLAVMKNHGFVNNPGEYMKALAEDAKGLGVIFQQACVKDFNLTDGKVTSVVTDKGQFECDAVVLATGVWSKPIAKKLGLNVPLESERGYHIEFKNPSVSPRVPLMITTGKFVATPMQSKLRCSGVIEFGGLKAPASEAPLKLLKRKVRQTFPKLKASEEVTWLGHRPAPSDSLPLIGEIKSTRVYAGFGHHHVGLTSGPKTGRILADLVTNKPTNMDLKAYEPMRF